MLKEKCSIPHTAILLLHWFFPASYVPENSSTHSCFKHHTTHSSERQVFLPAHHSPFHLVQMYNWHEDINRGNVLSIRCLNVFKEFLKVCFVELICIFVETTCYKDIYSYPFKTHLGVFGSYSGTIRQWCTYTCIHCVPLPLHLGIPQSFNLFVNLLQTQQVQHKRTVCNRPQDTSSSPCPTTQEN